VTDPKLELGRIEEKKKKKKTWRDPADPTRFSCNPLTFIFFLLKWRRFDYKKRIDPGDPMTRSKPGTRALKRAGSKNYE